MANAFITAEEAARREASLSAWEALTPSREPTVKLPSKVRARRPFELEARQCIITGTRDSLGARPSSRDENGMAYCGRPRLAKGRHPETADPLGHKTHFDAQYPWTGGR